MALAVDFTAAGAAISRLRLHLQIAYFFNQHGKSKHKMIMVYFWAYFPWFPAFCAFFLLDSLSASSYELASNKVLPAVKM